MNGWGKGRSEILRKGPKKGDIFEGFLKSEKLSTKKCNEEI